MKFKNVIFLITLSAILISSRSISAQDSEFKRKFDSLFVLAGSGSVLHQDLVEPAKDSIAAMGEEVVPLLIDKFLVKSARERWAVIHIFQRIGSPAVPYLVRALKRPDDLIVQRVCGALGDIKDSTAVEPLMEVCSSKCWQVRDQAVGALGKIGSVSASNVIIAALDDEIGQVRKSAAVGCGKMDLEQAAAKLVHVLGDDFYGARWSAVHSLLRMDTVMVTQVLADSLKSETPFVGDLGCYILGQFGHEKALDLLYLQTKSEQPNRRAHAAVALLTADPEDHCSYQHLMFERETDRLVLLKMRSALAAAKNDLE
ncbi:MAG TPA: HEAT repeat domain-containing protein [candidate division Zixibacteria bacterium]|nr:HEAT repeat domain-containing protein [candidate division Zixibacteria bacterium]